MANQVPRRLSESRATAAKMADEMTAIHDDREVSKRWHAHSDEDPTLRCAVTVQVWEDADGCSCVEVLSTDGVSLLEVKGILHDALYSLAHHEPSVVPQR